MNTSPLSAPGEASTPAPATPGRRTGLDPRRRRYGWVAGLLTLFIGYLLLGFLLVPYVVRTQLQSFVKTHYGRTLQVGEVRFNPMTFRLEARSVSLPDADGGPMVAFQRLQIQPALATFWRFAPSFREILLEQPVVHAIVRPTGALNLADLAKGLPESPTPARPEAPMRLYIDRFQVVAGAGEIEDRTLPTPLIEILRPINFDLRDFSTRKGSGNLYQLTATSARGAHLDWKGTFELQPLVSQGSFELTSLPVRTLWGLARSPLPVAVPPGAVDLHGQYNARFKNGTLDARVQLPEILLTNFKLRPETTPYDYIDLPRLTLRDTRVDLAQRTVDIGAIVETGGSIDAWIAPGGRLNLLELLPPRSPSPAHPAAGPAPAPTPAWRISAPDIEIQHLKIAAEDRQVTPAVRMGLDPLDLKVKGYTTAPGARLAINVDSAVNGGHLAVLGELALDTMAANGKVTVNGLELRGLQPYLAAQTGMTLLNGKLATDLHVDRGAEGAMTVKGEMRVSDVRTVDDEARQDFVRWKDLHIRDIQYASHPQSLKIGTITARAPYARVIVFRDLTTNVSEILTPKAQLHGRRRRETDKDRAAPPAEASVPVEKEQASPPLAAKVAPTRKGKKAARPVVAAVPAPLIPFPLSIRSIEFIGASANYADYWIQPNFAVGIQTLNGSIKGLSSNPSSRARVHLEGKVDRYAPALISGELNLLSATTYSDIRLSFKGLDMTTVTPYSGRFAGYKIDKGKLSVDLDYKIDKRQLIAEQHFVINQIQLGDRVESKDAIKLPVRLAIALLKDRNGVIDVDLPMTGSLDDPQFRLGPLIWKAFVNLLGKIVTAPFAALGHLFGGGETMNVIEFAPGNAQLDPAAQSKVASVVKALTERPALQLDIPASASELDRAQLVQKRLHQQLLQGAHRGRKKGAPPPDESVLDNPSEHFRLALTAYRAGMKGADLPQSAVVANESRSKDPAVLNPAIHDLEAPLLAHVQVPDSDLEELGNQRAQAIEDALVAGGVDASRLFVVRQKVSEGRKSDSTDKVRVEMSLK